MSQTSVQVTAAEISRLAGVTRATVSNWRRRHPDFPAPAGGSDSSPTYDLAVVRAWLETRGLGAAASPAEELRATLRLSTDHGALPAVALAAVRLPEIERDRLAGLDDESLLAAVGGMTEELITDLPGDSGGGSADPDVIRAVLRSVSADGLVATLEILAERELADSPFSGAYSTPLVVAGLMADLLRRESGDYPAHVLDPACGGGTLLEQAANRGADRLSGQEILVGQASRCAVRLLATAPKARVEIETGDSLRADAFPDLRADAVLTNPPYGERDWGQENLTYDPRWTYGEPARGESELAWVQHALAHLALGGRAVLLLPPSVASRGTGRRIRAELLRSGALRAIIALPPGAAVPAHVSLHLWVLDRPVPGEAAGPVLLADAPAENFAESVITVWRAFQRNPASLPSGVARSVAVVDLLDDEVDLTPARHLHTTDLDPAESSARAADLLGRLVEASAALEAAAHAPRWLAAAQRREWRMATVADLARGGVVEILREQRDGTPAVIEPGDVLLRRMVHPDQRAAAWIADASRAGRTVGPSLLAFRVDPERMHPGFFAGFLVTDANVAASSRGASGGISLDPRRLRIPLLPLDEQRRYAEAFAAVERLRSEARRAAALAADAGAALAEGLANGVLLPPPDSPVPR